MKVSEVVYDFACSVKDCGDAWRMTAKQVQEMGGETEASRVRCPSCHTGLITWKVKEVSVKRDEVDHPSHYNQHPTGVECIEIVEHMPFNVGNAIKYLWRAGSKSAETHITDLEKAAWYCRREIERLERMR